MVQVVQPHLFAENDSWLTDAGLPAAGVLFFWWKLWYHQSHSVMHHTLLLMHGIARDHNPRLPRLFGKPFGLPSVSQHLDPGYWFRWPYSIRFFDTCPSTFTWLSARFRSFSLINCLKIGWIKMWQSGGKQSQTTPQPLNLSLALDWAD